MQKIIGVTEMQRRFRSVFDEVSRQHIPYVLIRGSKPEAALIPYEEYLRFVAWKEESVLSRFDELMARMAERNATVNEEELEKDIEAEREALAR